MSRPLTLLAVALLLAPAALAQTDSRALSAPDRADTGLAEAPTLLSYSGLLTDAAGDLVADGTHALTFRAYASPDADAPLWTETHDALVTAGQFWIMLGRQTPLADGADWYTVAVDGAPESRAVELARDGSGDTSFAPGNTLDQSYENGSFVNIDQGRPLVLRGTAGSFYTGLQIQNITATFSNDELVRFRLRSVNGGASWEYRVYGAVSTGPTSPSPGTFSISNASSPGAIDPFAIDPTAVQDLLRLDGNTVNVGSAANEAQLAIYTTENAANSAATGATFTVYDFNGDGSASDWYEDGGDEYAVMQPDIDGEGGFFLLRNGFGGAALQVDGNDGSGSSVRIGAGAGGTAFDTDATASATVQLPNNAVEASEMLNEPGVANALSSSSMTLTGTPAVLLSRTLTAPTAGYVLAIAAADVEIPHTNGTTSGVEFGVSTDCDASPTIGSASDFDIILPTVAPTGRYNFSASPSGLFAVSAGATTFCLVGTSALGAGNFAVDVQVSLLFVPTAYGTATSNVADGTPSVAEGDGPSRAALTPGDIAAEQVQAARNNEARLQTELDEMRRRLDALESSREGNQR